MCVISLIVILQYINFLMQLILLEIEDNANGKLYFQNLFEAFIFAAMISMFTKFIWKVDSDAIEVGILNIYILFINDIFELSNK